MFRGEVRLNVEEKKTRAARERETRGGGDDRRDIRRNDRSTLAPTLGQHVKRVTNYTYCMWSILRARRMLHIILWYTHSCSFAFCVLLHIAVDEYSIKVIHIFSGFI